MSGCVSMAHLVAWGGGIAMFVVGIALTAIIAWLVPRLEWLGIARLRKPVPD